MSVKDRFFRALRALRIPLPVYYWLLDRLDDNEGWRPLFYRERARSMPSEFEPLAVYNSEKYRGIAHTRETDERMGVLQQRFDAWPLADREARS